MRSRESGPPPEMTERGKSENKEGGKDMIPTIPEGELHIEFVRSSGPGGQKVNKTSSKAQLRWNVRDSSVLSDDQKDLVSQVLANRINGEGEVVLSADTERSQSQNKGEVVSRLQSLVDDALTVQKERKATKPSKGQVRKRLDAKTRQGRKKQDRKKPEGGWE